MSVPLLCAAAYLGIGKSLEQCRSQLLACGNGLPHRVYALRWIFGGSDLTGAAVSGHCKGQYQVCHCYLKRNFRRRAYHQFVQRQWYGSGR